MADYFSPTVVQSDIPLTDMTPVEAFVLGHTFEQEVHGAGIYVFASIQIDDCPMIDIEALRAAEADSAGTVDSCRSS